MDDQQRAAAAEVLIKNDFRFWFDGVKVHDARARVAKLAEVRLTKAAFDEMRGQVCEWFGVRDHVRELPAGTCFTWKEWAALRKAVLECREMLDGKTINEAVAIVSQRFRCNAELLTGLASDVHFWQPFNEADADAVPLYIAGRRF